MTSAVGSTLTILTSTVPLLSVTEYFRQSNLTTYPKTFTLSAPEWLICPWISFLSLIKSLWLFIPAYFLYANLSKRESGLRQCKMSYISTPFKSSKFRISLQSWRISFWVASGTFLVVEVLTPWAISTIRDWLLFSSDYQISLSLAFLIYISTFSLFYSISSEVCLCSSKYWFILSAAYETIIRTKKKTNVSHPSVISITSGEFELRQIYNQM